MKLKIISEVVAMSSNRLFSHLKNIKNAATAPLPKRTRRYEKAEAKYTPSSPDPMKVCQNCINFKKDATCKYVEGNIDPSGVCKFFQVSNTAIARGNK